MPLDKEMTRPVIQGDDRVRLSGEPHQVPVPDELQIAARGCRTTPPPPCIRVSSCADDGPLSRSPARPSRLSGPPCTSIAADRSRAMLAITCGSWIDVDV